MVAPNSRLLKAFPLVRCVTTWSGQLVPERTVRAAADRGNLSQLEAWLDCLENMRKPDDPADQH
jgi:hypothetical protein